MSFSLYFFFEQAERHPRSLLHMDFRAENMFRSLDGKRMAYIDFQAACTGPPGMEFAQLIGSFDPTSFDWLRELEDLWYASAPESGRGRKSMQCTVPPAAAAAPGHGALHRFPPPKLSYPIIPVRGSD